jgi:hypothetical protein
MRTMTELVTRSDITLAADHKRVLARLFVPGHELMLDTVSAPQRSWSGSSPCRGRRLLDASKRAGPVRRPAP